MAKRSFISPEQYFQELSVRMESNQGRLLIASCRAGTYMADRVVENYRKHLQEIESKADVLYLRDIDRQFSDSETMVRLDTHVGGYDVFVFQSLLDPTNQYAVNDNYIAFLIAVRAFREHGANRITGVLPYLTYARQDKPTMFQREPTTAKLMADLARVAGVNRLIAWDPHSSQLHGFYGDTPVSMLSPVSTFCKEFAEFQNRDDVIAVAPDAGATKLVMHVSRLMGIRSAVASKYRPEQEEAVITDIIGDFRKKKVALVLDDMISSGGTIYDLVRKLVAEKGIEEVHLGASHNLCLPGTRDRLQELHENYSLKHVFVTNSIPQSPDFTELAFFREYCLSDILSRVVNRVHYNRSVSELFDNELVQS